MVIKKIDTQEFVLPETVFVRDIEDRVFQGIALGCLSQIDGIGTSQGNFFDTLLGRDDEPVKGIYVEQDSKANSLHIKVELNVSYGVSIPAKAEEIQTKISEEITKLTGLHVGSVHIIFKNIIPEDRITHFSKKLPSAYEKTPLKEEEYSDEF